MGGWLYLIRLLGARPLLGFGASLLGFQLLLLAGVRLLSLGVRLMGRRARGSWSKQVKGRGDLGALRWPGGG